ncbi:MAG: hypothetical protein LBJ67_12235, partial [Planctomycetaceae bacterium]|nr:hypothetical protein [Planctomycetaceae bacterium]
MKTNLTLVLVLLSAICLVADVVSGQEPQQNSRQNLMQRFTSARRVVATNVSADPLNDSADSLVAGFKTPPDSAKLWAYWWWLNGNVDKDSITNDLTEMSKQGFGGAIIFDAGGASQDGNNNVPAGPTFGTPEWRELYKHALKEAAKLGMSIS